MELPHPIAFIPVREWVTNESINQVFKRLYDNFMYLQDVSKVYQVAPVPTTTNDGETVYYSGWAYLKPLNGIAKGNHFNYFTSQGTETQIQTYLDIDTYYPIEQYTPITDISSFIGDTKNIYVGSKDRVDKFDYYLTANDGNTLENTDETEIYELTNQIKSFSVDSSNKIFILDDRKLIVKVYRFNEVVDDYLPVYEWGGIGGQLDIHGFYSPNDIFVSSNDKVFVTDTGNNCIKRFSNGGQWEYTYTSDSFTSGDIKTGGPISCILDANFNLYVITNTNLVKFKYDGTEIYSKPIQMLEYPPVKINHHKGFIYILTENNIIRVHANGESTNVFADRAELSSKIQPYKSIEIDTGPLNENYDRIYITDGTIIITYNDYPVVLDAAPAIGDYITFENMQVHPNAFVMPLTYNKFFSRLYDNLKQFYNTIEFKIIEKSNGTLERVNLETCDVWRDDPLPIEKDEIFIGMNELVTPEVMNRCIKQLLILQQYNLDILLNLYSACKTGTIDSFRLENPDIGNCGWTWEDRRTIICCLTWDRLQIACTKWEDVEDCQ